MSGNPHILELRTSPHLHGPNSVETIMRNVMFALLPIAAFAVFLFGISALALICTTTTVCVVTELLVCKLSKKESTLGDYSATITGLLLALTLPPGMPLWMAAVGSVVTVCVGKALFGGLGQNILNPVLVGNVFLQASFPVAATTWALPLVPERFTSFIGATLTRPFLSPDVVNVTSGSTPLALQKFEHVTTGLSSLFWGMTSGCTGETSDALILLCGAYLIARRAINWRIPASMLGSAFLTSMVFYAADPEKYPSPFFTLFAGGLVLGAVFLASDMVTSPVTPLGMWVYGGLIGFITVIIRLFSGQAEGVMYAILFGNAISPIIDNLTQPRIFGARRAKAKL
ncbi:MAG: RnfABCDGE type electron transport complex subunit D [Candidatus Hydrogenedentes bacterium]|nr:RnfABCDGE type electron transport complex subunit D [Candidatus Hydrogenedentota bacterium]